MKKYKYIKWFFLVSTSFGSLTSFAIYNALKKENNKSIKIDYNKVNSMLNDKGFKENFLNSNYLGENNKDFDKSVSNNINLFKKEKYNLGNLVDKSKILQLKIKYVNKMDHHVQNNNGELTIGQRDYLNGNNSIVGKLLKKTTLYSSSSQSWDDWTDKTKIDWIALSRTLEIAAGLLIAVAVIAAAAAAVLYALSFITFGGTLGDAIMCSQVCIKTATATAVVAGALVVIHASINQSDDRYTQMRKISKIFTAVVVTLGVFIGGLNASYLLDAVACPAVLITIAGLGAVLAAIVVMTHDQDESNNYFLMKGVHFNKNDIKNYSLVIDENKDMTLNINGFEKHAFKEDNYSTGFDDYKSLKSISPNKSLGENLNFHGQTFDITKINSYDVQVIDNKNTTLTINDGQNHQFKQSLADSNKDYDYLSSIMPKQGQGENFNFHGQSFDLKKVNSYDVQVIDNKNTTLTINDGQKHQFKQKLDDSNKDYDYLSSIMQKQGQGENFNLHGQSFDLRKVNSFDIQVNNNKNTTLTINDGQKHQFKQSLADSNKDYDYLSSIMPKQGQGENFNFHGQSFDITKVNSYDVQVIDNKNTTLTINDGQKHQFKQSLADANKDYAYLLSIMPTKGQGENFKFHGQLFDITKINSYDVQVIDNKNTTLTINDGQKHQFKQSLADSNKDYAYLLSIMPTKGQGENFKFQDQLFDITKINSFDVQVIDNKNTTLTINDGQKHQFKQNLDDSNKNYAYLQSIMPTKGQGENFKFHGQLFDITKINSYDVQVIDNKNTTLTINDGQKHQFKQSLADSNKNYAYLQSIMSTKGQGENFNFHNQSFDTTKISSYDVQVIDNKNTTLTINDGQKHQFKQNLADSNKDYAYLLSIMPTKGQGENFNFHNQSFDITKINSYDVQVIDNKNTTLTINDGQKHQFKQNLADSNKDYDYLSSIMPTKGKGESFDFHNDAYNLRKINYFKVKVIDPDYAILTINDGQNHIYKEKLSQSKYDYIYLSSITTNDGQGINYLDWNLIQSISVLLSIVLLIGLLVIGLETTRRRSLNNKNHNINVKKPSFEYRNSNFQFKKTNLESKH
ncbi:MAG: hypothetical protein ACRCW6_01220 [Mycoplasmoidaceae bacterium]